MIRRILEAETDADVMAVSGTTVADRRGRPLVSGDELHRLYKRVARTVHPDKTMSSTGSAEAFQKLHVAYESLMRRARAPADAESLASDPSSDPSVDFSSEEQDEPEYSDDTFELSITASSDEDSVVDPAESSCASTDSREA